jgi:predicted RNA-binding protein with PUA-like domain
MPSRTRYWLVKSEPDDYAFDALLREPERKTPWTGVRNYQARNFMRDEMRVGDKVLFYHSSTEQPAVVGLAEVASQAYPDPTQFEPDSPYFDAKATPDAPRWFLVDIRALEPLARPVALAELKRDPALATCPLVRRGNRLSVMPLSADEYARVLELAKTPCPP